MLHGRRAFTDPRRELERINVWLADPMPAPATLVERGAAAARVLAAALATEPAWIQEAFGVAACDDPLRTHIRRSAAPLADERDRELARVLAALTRAAVIR
jgi:hypothetical protein